MRAFLEMDELVALTDAAGEQDAAAPVQRSPSRDAETPPQSVAARCFAGMRPARSPPSLACRRRRSPTTSRRLGADGPATYVGRRAIVATLGGSGVRGSELCDMRLCDVRLHDPTGARFRIPDAKTEAGIREVQMSPDLAGARQPTSTAAARPAADGPRRLSRSRTFVAAV